MSEPSQSAKDDAIEVFKKAYIRCNGPLEESDKSQFIYAIATALAAKEAAYCSGIAEVLENAKCVYEGHAEALECVEYIRTSLQVKGWAL